MICIKCNFPNISFKRLEYPIIFIYILSIIEEKDKVKYSERKIFLRLSDVSHSVVCQ